MGILSNYCGLGGSGLPKHLVDEICKEHDENYNKIQKEGKNPYFTFNWADQRMLDRLHKLPEGSSLSENFIKSVATGLWNFKKNYLKHDTMPPKNRAPKRKPVGSRFDYFQQLWGRAKREWLQRALSYKGVTETEAIKAYGLWYKTIKNQALFAGRKHWEPPPPTETAKYIKEKFEGRDISHTQYSDDTESVEDYEKRLFEGKTLSQEEDDKLVRAVTIFEEENKLPHEKIPPKKNKNSSYIDPSNLALRPNSQVPDWADSSKSTEYETDQEREDTILSLRSPEEELEDNRNASDFENFNKDLRAILANKGNIQSTPSEKNSEEPHDTVQFDANKVGETQKGPTFTTITKGDPDFRKAIKNKLSEKGDGGAEPPEKIPKAGPSNAPDSFDTDPGAGQGAMDTSGLNVGDNSPAAGAGNDPSAMGMGQSSEKDHYLRRFAGTTIRKGLLEDTFELTHKRPFVFQYVPDGENKTELRFGVKSRSAGAVPNDIYNYYSISTPGSPDRDEAMNIRTRLCDARQIRDAFFVPYWFTECSMTPQDWEFEDRVVSYKPIGCGFEIVHLHVVTRPNDKGDPNQVPPSMPCHTRMWKFVDLDLDYGLPVNHVNLGEFTHSDSFRDEDGYGPPANRNMPKHPQRDWYMHELEGMRLLNDYWVQTYKDANFVQYDCAYPNMLYDMRQKKGYNEFLVKDTDIKHWSEFQGPQEVALPGMDQYNAFTGDGSANRLAVNQEDDQLRYNQGGLRGDQSLPTPWSYASIRYRDFADNSDDVVTEEGIKRYHNFAEMKASPSTDKDGKRMALYRSLMGEKTGKNIVTEYGDTPEFIISGDTAGPFQMKPVMQCDGDINAGLMKTGITSRPPMVYIGCYYDVECTSKGLNKYNYFFHGQIEYVSKIQIRVATGVPAHVPYGLTPFDTRQYAEMRRTPTGGFDIKADFNDANVQARRLKKKPLYDTIRRKQNAFRIKYPLHGFLGDRAVMNSKNAENQNDILPF